MKIKAVKTFSLYLVAIATILCWWWFAFAFSPTHTPTTNDLSAQSSQASQSHLISMLTPLNREMLQKALAGDTALMIKLIANWDIDAQLLELAGHADVKRLPRHSYLRSQVLGRPLTNSKSSDPKFLPQTYVAASLLLALTETKQIVALPKGLRQHTHLFPLALTKEIPLDIDRYNAETLYLAQPQVAFVAHYSHPALIEVLRNQGVQLFTMNHLDSVKNIQSTLLQVGQVINRPHEAELLAMFMEAAMFAIDNRMSALRQSWSNQEFPNVLFVYYHHQYTTPTPQALTGQLLQRLGISQSPSELSSANGWTIPIHQEQIVNLNPRCLIVATPYPQAVKEQFDLNPAFADVPAIKQGNVFFVDEVVQQFPSQYVVLAYYDLFQALAKTL